IRAIFRSIMLAKYCLICDNVLSETANTSARFPPTQAQKGFFPVAKTTLQQTRSCPAATRQTSP
ncbi:MAG TPA: hypothetical protein VIS71_07460, partial [Terrimicrobium sp.]